MKENFSISFDWEVKTAEDTERVGAMYCFKRCDVRISFTSSNIPIGLR